MISASGWAYGLILGPFGVICGINNVHFPPSDVPDASALVGQRANDPGQTLALNGNVSLPAGGTVSIKCKTFDGGTHIGYGWRLTALLVSNVNGSVFAPTKTQAPQSSSNTH
jgi:hypothetical protein